MTLVLVYEEGLGAFGTPYTKGFDPTAYIQNLLDYSTVFTNCESFIMVQCLMGQGKGATQT